MTSIMDQFRAFFNKSEVKEINTQKNLLSPNIETLQRDKKIQTVAKQQIKQSYELSLFDSIKDVFERNKVKNAHNIFKYILHTDLTKFQLKSEDLKIAVEYCTNRSVAGNISEEENRDIVAFFDKISYLPNDIFERKQWLGGKVALQKILSQELAKLLEAQESHIALKQDTAHQLNISIAKAKLSIKLGYGVSAAGGCNGAQIVKDLEGKNVGVFKPKPNLQWYQITENLKKYFGQARLLNQKDDMGQQFAEVAAHQFDSIMGFKLAPAATMVQMKGQEGAFLAFLGGYKELVECEERLERKASYNSNEKTMWQKMCIYNFLVANLDPHNENIFVKMDEHDELKEVRVIDHGNCFIEQNPGERAPIGNQGHWGQYKISDAEFTPDVIEFIRNNLTEAKLDRFVKQVGGQRDQFWTLKMDQLQRQRLSVLRNAVLNGEIKSPRELAKLHTTLQLHRYNEFSTQKVISEETTDLGDFAVLDIN